MKYGALKNLILDALEQQFCIPDSIKKLVETELQGEITQEDFDELLERIEDEGKIVLLNNGAFSAYFPAEKIPSSYFRAGYGKVNAVYDAPNVGLPVLPVSRVESAELSKISDDDEFDIEITLFFTTAELELITELTTNNFSNKDIAAQLKVPERLFSLRARNHLPTRQAISDGHKNRKLGVQIAATAEAVAIESPPVDTHRKPKQRVVDVRPAARLVITEFSDADGIEPFPRRKSLSPEKSKRLCLCGNPLGARANECKTCWLELRGKITPRTEQKTDPVTDRKIKEVLANTDFDREKLSEIAIEVFLEFAPAKVKEKFAERLWQELIKATENAEMPE